MYYKAMVCLTTETMDADGFCTGEYTDQGEINRYTAPSIHDLFTKLAARYDLTTFETFENKLEASFEVIGNDGVSYLEQYSIYITQVDQSDVTEAVIDAALKEYTK